MTAEEKMKYIKEKYELFIDDCEDIDVPKLLAESIILNCLMGEPLYDMEKIFTQYLHGKDE